MSQVGEFPGLQLRRHQRTIRAPLNPLDKSTVISILPKPIHEKKATIQPSDYEIAPGFPESPAILVVTSASWWREIDENQPLLEIPVSSVQVADSVVRDYCNGLLACNMSDKMPGLFYIPGAFTLQDIQKNYKNLISDADKKQRNWFNELIKIADIMWSRTNGNPLSISDDARLACKMLNITNKPWLGDFQTQELVRCVACGALRNPQFPICGACKAIADPELAKQLNLTFAK